ncbi:hypothetical protein [Janthinobacterium sp. LB2P10]|uniref:hypothetical protein n=1 Tax=Janthinobacterium sp. LB2P10 TaxID=3424194 RepID=UPI003F246BB3
MNYKEASQSSNTPQQVVGELKAYRGVQRTRSTAVQPSSCLPVHMLSPSNFTDARLKAKSLRIQNAKYNEKIIFNIFSQSGKLKSFFSGL